MGLMKTLSQSSEELKNILDRLTALENLSNVTGKDDIFSVESVTNSGSNVALNKDEIIANFKMPESIDL